MDEEFISVKISSNLPCGAFPVSPFCVGQYLSTRTGLETPNFEGNTKQKMSPVVDLGHLIRVCIDAIELFAHRYEA